MGDADVIKPLQPFHFLRTLTVKLSLLADRVLCLGQPRLQLEQPLLQLPIFSIEKSPIPQGIPKAMLSFESRSALRHLDLLFEHLIL